MDQEQLQPHGRRPDDELEGLVQQQQQQAHMQYSIPPPGASLMAYALPPII